MAISFENVVIHRGEHFFLKFEGSAEKALLIMMAEDGRCFISGPQSSTRKTYRFDTLGFHETTKEEMEEAFAK